MERIFVGDFMRVCVLGTRGFPMIGGGVEKHCESLYPLLNDDIELIVFRRKPYVNSAKTYKNIRFIDLPSTKIKGVEAVFHSFLATIRAIMLKPDIVHIHNIGPSMFAPLLKLFGIRVVMTYHSPNYEHDKWDSFAKKILRFSENIALKFSNMIIFVNKFQMEKYPKFVQEKSVYIPNGIDAPLLTENKNFLEQIGAESGKYILSVGRITAEKGFDTLINAYKKADVKDYKLVIAGGVDAENKYYEQLKAMADNENIIFTGYVYGDDLAQLFQNAALYVLPSNNEGFPMVMLEAMNYKLDMLVSDIPATHLINLDKEDYFPKGDSETLSIKLEEKLRYVSKREYDLTEFDWDKVSKQVEKIYKEIA